MSVSPRTGGQDSLGLQPVQGAKRRPLTLRGRRFAGDKPEKKKEAKSRKTVLSFAGSGGAIQQLLRLCLHIEAGILVRLVTRDRRDALHEIEDAFRRSALLRQHRFYHL